MPENGISTGFVLITSLKQELRARVNPPQSFYKNGYLAKGNAGKTPCTNTKSRRTVAENTPRLDGLTLGLLLPARAGSRGPGEVGHRDYEEAVGVVGNTGQGVVPGGKGRHETEETTGHDDGRVGLALGVTVDVPNTQQQEGQVQEEEQQEEGHRRSQGAEEKDSGEDEPALKLKSACAP